MKSTTRFLMRAVAVAIVLSGAGFSYQQSKHSKTVTTQRSCETASRDEMEKFNSQHGSQTGPWTVYQTAGLTCDPVKLNRDTAYDVVLPGVQRELLTAYREEHSGNDGVMYGFAFLIVLIGALPAVWYFFLARLAEIAAAVRRN